MYKFQIHNKVKAIKSVDNKHLGECTGIIVHIKPGMSACRVGVQFDKSFLGGHNCQGHGKHGFCRYGYEDEFKLIPSEWNKEENEH